MRLALKILGWTLALVLVCVVALGLLVATDSRPLVPRERVLAPSERAWAQRWLQSARPRSAKVGEGVTLKLSEPEANILGAYLIDRLGEGRIAVRFEDNRARIAASLGLPWNPRARFLNLAFDLVAGAPMPRVERAHLAGLALPNGLIQTLADRLADTLVDHELIEGIVIGPGRAQLTYRWRPHALERLGSGLLSAEERERMIGYQEGLVRYAATRIRAKSIPLGDLVSLLMTEAHRRSASDGLLGVGTTSAAEENRAAILALAAYTNGRTVRNPDEGPGAAAREISFRTVELRGRRDLAQHFATSAALAVEGGDALSDLLGLLKEVQDSDGGSGFSFADLTADRAGTRFGRVATRDSASARAVQRVARQGLTADDIMPSLDGLPEGIDKAAFTASYGSSHNAAFRAAAEGIERRIDRLSLHKTVGG